ncbi:hypothetical protein FKM82_021198 [Ascaphus truei]
MLLDGPRMQCTVTTGSSALACGMAWSQTHCMHHAWATASASQLQSIAASRDGLQSSQPQSRHRHRQQSNLTVGQDQQSRPGKGLCVGATLHSVFCKDKELT